MKLLDLLESYEDVPEIDVRSLSRSDRMTHYHKVKMINMSLMNKARNFFYAHREYKREQPEDMRIYQYSMDARAVTQKMNPSEQHQFVCVLNITNDKKKRERIRQKALDGKSYDDNTYFIPITNENKKFREKVLKMIDRFLKWEAAYERAAASYDRLDREDRKERQGGGSLRRKLY